MSIRFVVDSDCAALLSIYAQYIETGVTFESPLPTRRAFQERIAGIAAMYPYLVYEEDGRILGYAYAHRYRERAAYDWDAELSVYLDRSSRRRGIGTKLYGALLELLTMQGVINAYGLVSTPNEGSEALHAHMGFVRGCTYQSMGYKLGRWLDVTSFSKQLGPYAEHPVPVTPIGALPREQVQAVLARYQ